MTEDSNNIHAVKLEEVSQTIVPENMRTRHKIKFLSVDGKCFAREALIKLAAEHLKEYKKLIKTLHNITSQKYVANPQKVQYSDSDKVYEAKANAGKARLFFFYTEDDEIVICLNDYWKGKKRTQSKAFAIAGELKKLYEDSLNN